MWYSSSTIRSSSTVTFYSHVCGYQMWYTQEDIYLHRQKWPQRVSQALGAPFPATPSSLLLSLLNKYLDSAYRLVTDFLALLIFGFTGRPLSLLHWLMSSRLMSSTPQARSGPEAGENGLSWLPRSISISFPVLLLGKITFSPSFHMSLVYWII